ncbi:MAG: cytochrome b6-f complex iron-sulfur subunit [Pseudonocardiales bacterium]|nr:cytochrome b6-f complex iron-sulfur subunit [Pseudonocardiales bacterium]
MSERAELSRRAVLGGGAGLAGIAALALAGCGTGATPDAASTEAPSAALPSSGAISSHSSAPDAIPSTAPRTGSHSTPAHSTPPHSTPPHSTAPHSTAPHSRPAASSPAAASAPPAPRPSSSPVPPAGALAKLSAIPVGGSVAAMQAGKPITLARPSMGTVAAFSAVCTHLGCTVNAGGPRLHCPCHGSIFNAFTGQVVQGPASSPLPSIAVHVADGYVVSG